jgi:NUMOD4 motif-containing protein/HNH endonuclease
MSTEQWRPVVGFPDYEVSDHGRVRSVDRIKLYTQRSKSGRAYTVERKHHGRLLRAGTMKSGHQIVILGRGNPRCVHALVLEAFVGLAPTGTECCHWDDDPANNRLSNLRWDTRASNLADYKRNHGRHVNGAVAR